MLKRSSKTSRIFCPRLFVFVPLAARAADPLARETGRDAKGTASGLAMQVLQSRLSGLVGQDPHLFVTQKWKVYSKLMVFSGSKPIFFKVSGGLSIYIFFHGFYPNWI